MCVMRTDIIGRPNILIKLWRTDTDKIMKVVYTTFKTFLKYQRIYTIFQSSRKYIKL